MLKRNIYKYLLAWKEDKSKKPLLVRGARQIGKTFIVEAFGKEHYEKVFSLNLERYEDQELFRKIKPADEFLRDLSIKFQTEIVPGKSLIFIDEIQNSPEAMTQLRFFYEERPEFHVIAAGSLLEVALEQKRISIPVGRVQYCYMFPMTFEEFLPAMGYSQSLDYLNQITLSGNISENIHGMIAKQYREYLLIGGMPEIVSTYSAKRSYASLETKYETLIRGFRDDIHKYGTKAQMRYLEHVFDRAPLHVGSNVTYKKFSGSEFKSTEISNAFSLLEKALILTRIRATTSFALPVIFNQRISPKLLFLDVGLVNYRAGIGSEYSLTNNISDIFRGQIAEQIVGQSLLSLSAEKQIELGFWTRNKAGSNAEIDFILPMDGQLFPIEVKTGASGRLRSLHQFFKYSKSNVAIRVYSGPLLTESLKTPEGVPFQLISLPFYLLGQLPRLLKKI
jgi:predicted AAA+ superfamily ATPase